MPLFRSKSKAAPEQKEPPRTAMRRMYAEMVQKAFRMRFVEKPPAVLTVEPSERPFDGEILAFRRPEHWKLVTIGIWAPPEPGQDEIPALELSLSAPAGDDDQPPAWASRLLRVLADQVVGTRVPFLPGHRLENKNPLDDDPASNATCLLFTQDTDLRTIEGPWGVTMIVQLVPVTRDELLRAKETSTEEVVEALRADSPELIASLRR